MACCQGLSQHLKGLVKKKKNFMSLVGDEAEIPSRHIPDTGQSQELQFQPTTSAYFFLKITL
jgi:hypothetical protein